ncbi:hypothetical protein AB0C11_27875 [Streptomyces sp. NPDC039016]|uniref:hypothetical protein n=1 Tax=Streptomyces sp. NPDC039016 TaxID=3154330 RepID=UPI0033F645D4
MSADDIYREALGQLGIRLEISSTSHKSVTGKAEASGEVGIHLIAKAMTKFGMERTRGKQSTTKPIAADVQSLNFVVELLRGSERPLVIEDFHYLSITERKRLAHDMKAMWDINFPIVIVGVWNQQNMLFYLNDELTGRVHEIPVTWNHDDLDRIFQQGGAVLNVEFTQALRDHAIEICYGSAGILQMLILRTLEKVGVEHAQSSRRVISNVNALNESTLFYAEQLHPRYQEFARRVSRGIRERCNSTAIYAHAMAAILSATDEELSRGVNLSHIFSVAHGRESRITRQNLKSALARIESLQVDEEGKGLVLAYNTATADVTVVDRQLLLYRRYSTIGWPWEDLISEASGNSRFKEDET